MIKHVNAVIFKVKDLERSLQFYRLLGLKLEKEDHDGGPIHYACDLGNIHFALFEAESDQEFSAGCLKQSMVGFEMKDLNSVMSLIKETEYKVLKDIENVPWGRRAIIEDPCGRPIELNQK